MLKSKEFWVGFFIAYFLVIFVPQVNIMGYLGKRGGGMNG